MTITLNALQKQRRDTASNWTSNNPTLLDGEFGWETDTKKLKIGDGSTAWQSLDYLPIPDTNRLLPGNLTVGGNFTVNGTSTTIDTTTLTVEDINIEIGKVSTPSDTTADGGGITLKGATDKTINWVDSTDSWTFSEHLDLASGKVLKSAGTQFLSSTQYTGNSATATALATARTIGGVSFDGTANIDLPGVNSVGNQNTTGSAATLTTPRTIAGVSFDGSANISLNNNSITNGAGYIDGSSLNASNLSSGTVPDSRLPATLPAISGVNLTSLNASNLGSGTVPDARLPSSISSDITGNAATATALATARTIAGVSFDGTANISLNNNAITNGAGYITATLTNEEVQDIVGAMLTGNTETGITVTYQDSDGTIDFVVGTLNQDTTGNAATATALETARNIGGVSFDGTGNINLPGVNTSGNQNTSGNAATATKLATARTIAGVSFDGSANISLNNNAITNGAGYLTSVGTANISDDAVTFAKIENIAQNRIIGRVASGSGDATTLTAANVRSMINVEDGATADLTGSEIRALLAATSNTNILNDTLLAKLNGIEAGADVTDATNVDSAGAVMNSDTSTASMNFVVDEDNFSSNSATKVPTQQSVKAYVDANAGGGGISSLVQDTSPQLGGDLQSNGNDIDFADNDKAIFGTGSDLKIYHDGSDSRIQDSSNLKITTNNLVALNYAETQYILRGLNGAQVELYHAGDKRLETTTNGATITGGLTTTGYGNTAANNTFAADMGHGARNVNIFASSTSANPYYSFVGTNLKLNNTNLVKNSDDSGNNWGNIAGIVFEGANQSSNSGKNPAIRFLLDQPAGNGLNYSLGSHEGSGSQVSAITSRTAAYFDTNGHFYHPDSKRSKYGTGEDLQIYHDGSNSFIDDSGTGNLVVRSSTIAFENAPGGGENLAKFIANGAVELYYDNVKHFETYSLGVRTNNKSVFINGDTGKFVCGAGSDLQIYHDGTDSYIASLVTGNVYHRARRSWYLGTNATTGGSDKAIHALENAAVELYYDNSKKFETQSGGVAVTGEVTPSANNSYNLGHPDYRWANVYTNDLNLSNEGGMNDVDGTWGSYTIQEGEDTLFLLNKRNGKKYKFNLTEVT